MSKIYRYRCSLGLTLIKFASLYYNKEDELLEMLRLMQLHDDSRELYQCGERKRNVIQKC